jgi:adenylate cyclase
MERRLAAIMATDVVGYSRLIRADEEGTLEALQAPRAGFFCGSQGARGGSLRETF